MSFNLQMQNEPKPIPVRKAKRVSRTASAAVPAVFLVGLLVFADAILTHSAGTGWLIHHASVLLGR